ncbi:MAG: hypothetical protein AAGC88_10525, partial [Bacteroidota bacterium]
NTPVQVVEYYAAIGDTLTDGSKLIALRSDFISELAANRVKLQNELNTFQSYTRPRMEVELNNLSEKVAERQVLLEQIQGEINEIEYYQKVALSTIDSMIGTAQKQYNRTNSLNEFKVASDQELENSSNILLQAKAEKNSINSEYIFQKTGLLNEQWETKREIADLEKEILLTRSRSSEEEKKLNDSWNDLNRRVELFFGKGARLENDQMIIVTQSDGVVTYLGLKSSMHKNNEIIARIAFDEESVRFVADVDQRAYSFIKTGERVNIDMEAYPHYRYGKIKGVVSSISISDDQTDRYVVEISDLDLSGYSGKLIPGYVGEATVFSDSYTVFQYFKQSFKKITSFPS